MTATERESKMPIVYMVQDLCQLDKTIGDMIKSVQQFKETEGDFGEKVPKIIKLLDEAAGKVEDAIAEAGGCFGQR
jgi:hypothetical protein